ncbi:MAG: GMC family oxidoreductase [Actinomycetes bacterium]
MASSDVEEIPDVLIIGSGPSGAIVAGELSAHGFSVVCLEQGEWHNNDEFPGRQPEWELLGANKWHRDQNIRRTPSDYPVEVSQSDITPIMFAGVGGSSVLYGGHWMRMLPSDFRMHSLDGVATDWPLTYDELAPFYDAVESAVGTAGVPGDPAYLRGPNPPLPPHPIGGVGRTAARGLASLGWHWWPASNAIASQRFGGLTPCVRWGTCETGCPEGAKASFDLTHWPKALNAGTRLVTGARVRQVTLDSRGRADGALYLDRLGREHHQRGRMVVLAANGVGTPRLLLLSSSPRFPDGLANGSGMVGKRLMLHPTSAITAVYEEDLKSWMGPAGQAIYSLQFYETDLNRGFAGGAKWECVPTGGPMRAVELLSQDGFDSAWGPGAQDRVRSVVGHSVHWGILANDLPDESNRITLDPVLKDSDGIAAPRSNYRISENSQRLLAFHREKMNQAISASGALRTFEESTSVEAGHLMGTATMGDDPETSVVDKWGVTHEVPNLCIVDGSVMPTGGGVNPTATIAALALRAATHLVSQARWQEVSG